MKDNEFILTLSKPIMAWNEEIKELKFRAPNGGDLLTVGNPVDLDMSVDPPAIRHNWKAMPEMISRLAGVPPSTIRQMTPNDIVSAAWLISPFFLPAEILG